MSERRTEARVGVRELRQNLSVYLDRVKAGESLEVTEHGHPVARLEPLAASDRSVLERLIREGRARPGRGSLSDLEHLKAVSGPSLSALLQALRDEEER